MKHLCPHGLENHFMSSFSALNLFNPLSYVAPFFNATPARDTSPIAIDPRSSDPGLKITAGRDSVTLRGTTRGFETRDSFLGGSYEIARGVSFTLDINKASTTDTLGKTDYTEKNSRIFTLDTHSGQSAVETARALAAKVNAGDDFSAKVTARRDGSAKISFERL
jgi:hypothetical protein